VLRPPPVSTTGKLPWREKDRRETPKRGAGAPPSPKQEKVAAACSRNARREIRDGPCDLCGTRPDLEI
jgi:hypothetical protein